MGSRIAKILRLSDEQARTIESHTAPLRSVSDYLISALEAAEHVPLAQTLASFATPAKAFAELFNELTEETDPEQLGFIACTLAYQQSAIEALEAVGKPKRRIPLALPKDEVKSQIEKADLSDAKSLRGFSLQNPTPHPFIQRANRGLYALVRAAGYSEAEWRNILGELRKSFAENLTRILEDREQSTRFEPFKNWLSHHPDAYLACTFLDRHAERQRRLFEEERVFRSEPFALRQV